MPIILYGDSDFNELTDRELTDNLSKELSKMKGEKIDNKKVEITTSKKKYRVYISVLKNGESNFVIDKL